MEIVHEPHRYGGLLYSLLFKNELSSIWFRSVASA